VRPLGGNRGTLIRLIRGLPGLGVSGRIYSLISGNLSRYNFLPYHYWRQSGPLMHHGLVFLNLAICGCDWTGKSICGSHPQLPGHSSSFPAYSIKITPRPGGFLRGQLDITAAGGRRIATDGSLQTLVNDIPTYLETCSSHHGAERVIVMREATEGSEKQVSLNEKPRAEMDSQRRLLLSSCGLPASPSLGIPRFECCDPIRILLPLIRHCF
jgi:hypothetical protein